MKTEHHRSAGGLVVEGERILLISTQDGRRWQLPKGHIEPGESPEQAAVREVREETGVTGRVLAALPGVEYWFIERGQRRVHKQVEYFLLAYISGDAADFDRDEVSGAQWFSWEEGIDKLSFDNERRVVRSIKYEGMKSITVSEILDRFKERKVGLSVESQYDPNRVQRAAVVLKEYLSERGRQFAEVEPEIRQIPPSSLEITFNVKEGPKVKVGDIELKGNNVMGDRAVVRAMKNLRPIGIPYSIFLEGLFAKTYDSTKLEEDKDRIRDAYDACLVAGEKTRDLGGTLGTKEFADAVIKRL